MDLRQLRFFEAVVEEKGFRKASRQLYVAQPSVSRALHQLEQELGVELLRRTARGTELTDAGHEFAVHARRILQQADDAKAAMRERATPRSRFRVGVVAGLLGASELTAPILSDHREAFPHLDAQFAELSFCDQAGPLLAGDLDVALVRCPLEHPDLEVIPIAHERRALLVGADHDLAGEEEVCVDDVLDAPMLPLGSPDHWAGFWQLDDVRGGSNADVDAPPARTIQDMQMAVAAGRLVIGVPDGMSRLAPHPLGRYVRLRDAAPSTIAVARRRHDRSAAVEGFLEQAMRTTEERIDLLVGGVLAG